MSEALDHLAAMVGIEPSYLALTGETISVSDDAKRATLAAMGIAAGDDDAIAASIAALTPIDFGGMSAPEGVACFVPDWLKQGRAWGIGCQLYGLRSTRNWGIGDFEDLARFAEIAAAAGADFVGVNPLHALFASAPERSSPFSPSNRQFLNPLYIAVDKAPGFEGMADALVPPDGVREAELVDYRHVGPSKLKALLILFRIFQTHGDDEERADYERFVATEGTPLYLHALFETLSAAMVQLGNGPSWHGWPDEYSHPGTDAVRAFAEEQKELVAFHAWLQWLADRQLVAAKTRAHEAGLRIGFYLDLAVGVAPDGSATWSDRDLTVPTARIGAPPDYFNEAGQDWGLAPLSPAALVARGFEPYRESIDAALRHAGALRIDHAMSLFRLFWIAEGVMASDGVYVRYPFHDMLNVLASVSQARHAIVIGEDLGVVPSGFREVMQSDGDPELSRLLLREASRPFRLARALPARGACLPHHPRSSYARRLVERARHRGASQDRHGVERRSRAAARRACALAAAPARVAFRRGASSSRFGGSDARRSRSAARPAGEHRRRAAPRDHALPFTPRRCAGRGSNRLA